MSQASISQDVSGTRGSVVRAWFTVGVAFLLALYGWGLGFYGQAVFLAEFKEQRGWSASFVSLALTLYYLVGAAFLAVVSDAFCRFGPRATTMAGAACLAVGAGGLAFVADPWQLIAANILMAVGWSATSATAVMLLLAPWFNERRGLAVSLALNGASAAGFLIAPLLVAVIQTYGFNTAVPWTAGLMLVIIIPFLLAGAGLPPTGYIEPVGARRRRSPNDQSEHATRYAGALVLNSRAAAVRSPVFWTLAAPFALGFVAQVGFLMHQVALLQPLIGATDAGYAVALTTLAAVIGRIAFGFIADRAPPRMATFVAFQSQAVALTVLAFALAFFPERSVLYACSFVFGLSVGVVITLPALVAGKDFAPESFGLVVGFSVAIGQFAFAFGPLLVGVLHDLTGGYIASLALCAACKVGAALLILTGPSIDKSS